MFDVELLRHGFYPVGGSHARVCVQPPPQTLVTLRCRKGRYWTTALSEYTQTSARTIEKFLPLAFVFTPRGSGVVVEVVS